MALKFYRDWADPAAYELVTIYKGFSRSRGSSGPQRAFLGPIILAQDPLAAVGVRLFPVAQEKVKPL